MSLKNEHADVKIKIIKNGDLSPSLLVTTEKVSKLSQNKSKTELSMKKSEKRKPRNN